MYLSAEDPPLCRELTEHHRRIYYPCFINDVRLGIPRLTQSA